MSSPDHRDSGTGPRAAAISNAIVGLLHEYTGRGPTRARTTISDDLVICVLSDTLTDSERRLVDAGEERMVLDERSTFQRLMRDDAIQQIESLTGRQVSAFMSTNHIDPDMAMEAFVLKPQRDGTAAAGDRPD